MDAAIKPILGQSDNLRSTSERGKTQTRLNFFLSTTQHAAHLNKNSKLFEWAQLRVRLMAQVSISYLRLLRSYNGVNIATFSKKN